MASGIGAETAIVDAWVSATLLSDPTVTSLCATRVYLDRGPDGEIPYPFIVYQMQSETDLRVVGTSRVWADTLYVVKAVAQSPDFSLLAPVAAAIDTALTSSVGGSVASPTGQTLSCVREQQFRLTEVDAGQEYRYLGGLYRIYAQGS